MSIFTKHNNLEIPTTGTKNWDATLNETMTVVEQGHTFTAIAGITVSMHEVGYLDSNHEWAKAKANASSEEGRWLGFFTADISQDTQGYARYTGYQKNTAWNFTPGLVWLSDSVAGAVTQTEPDSAIVVGVAIQTNEILIKPWNVLPEVDLISSNPGEGHTSIVPWNHDSTIQGGWIPVEHIGPFLYFYSYNTGASDGDKVRFKVSFAAGTYKFRMNYGKADNRGIIEMHIDDVLTGGPWDAYNSSQIWNQQVTVSDIVITESGLKNVDLSINGKNASSDNYFMLITLMEFYRTA